MRRKLIGSKALLAKANALCGMIRDTVLDQLSTRLFNRFLRRENLALEPVDAGAALPEAEQAESPLLRTLGWVTAGLGAVAFGLFVGRELRQRYKFNRRTPYDFYAHSGDREHELEFGVGI